MPSLSQYPPYSFLVPPVPSPQSGAAAPCRWYLPMGVSLWLWGVLALHPPYKTCSASSAYLTSALHSWTAPLTPSRLGGGTTLNSSHPM